MDCQGSALGAVLIQILPDLTWSPGTHHAPGPGQASQARYAERKDKGDAAQEIQPAPLEVGSFVRCAAHRAKRVGQKDEADGDIEPEQSLFDRSAEGRQVEGGHHQQRNDGQRQDE
jgi:hypothetical protein